MYKTSPKSSLKFIAIIPNPNHVKIPEQDDKIADVNEQEQKEDKKQELIDHNVQNIEVEDVKTAFEKEAIPHIKALYNYAYKMIGNKLDADDMIQETYLRAFRFFSSYEKGTNCKAWLFTIMKNVIINKFRKDQKEAANVDYEEVNNFIHSIKSIHFDMDEFQENLYSKLLDDEMMTALNSIHDDFKIVVILCDLEGLSYEEMAEFLHIPIGTVRSRLHRGRRLLQKKLFTYAKQKGFDVYEAA